MNIHNTLENVSKAITRYCCHVEGIRYEAFNYSLYALNKFKTRHH